MIHLDAHVADDNELIGNPPGAESAQLLLGTVGWDGVDELADLGTKGDGGKGRTLVRVTLYKGRNPATKPKTGVAQGHLVLVQVSWPFFVVPPRNAQVLVAFPDGDIANPGSGIIVACYADSANTSQFREDRPCIDVGPNMDLVIKGRSVTVTDTYGAPGRFFTVGKPPSGGNACIIALDETGTGWTVQSGAVGLFSAEGGDAKTVVQLTKSEVSIVQKASGLIKMKDGKLTVLTEGSLGLIGAQVAFGGAATPLTPALYGPTGVAGVASTSVFISP